MSVYIKDNLINDVLIERICHDVTECVVLLFKGSLFKNLDDIILVFAYVSPEYSTFYDGNDNNDIDILFTKINHVIADLPKTEFVAGDLNSRFNDFNDFIPEDDPSFIFGNDINYSSDINLKKF